MANSPNPPLTNRIDGLTNHRKPLPALTGVRFFAAFYVVLFHALPWLAPHFHLPKMVLTFLGNGYLAVALFFLLSGFILAYTYEGQIEGGSNRKRFWEARFARIYPVYFLSLVLAAWFEPGLRLGTRVLVLCMVQAWNPRTPELIGAWNYPAWTLSVEAFFYLCFPFLLPALARFSKTVLQWLGIALLCICIFAQTPLKGLGNLDHSSLFAHIVPLPVMRIPEFLLGAVLGLVFLRNLKKESGSASGWRTWLALLFAILSLSLPLGNWVSIVVAPFAVLIYELARGQEWPSRVLSQPAMVLLGGASYAIYLLQFPVRSIVREFFGFLPDILGKLGSPLTPVLLIIFSILVFKFWEEPARKQLRQWFAGSKSRVVRNPG